MGGFFGVASKADCVADVFYGTDYHSHLGTSRGGMVTVGESGFNCRSTPGGWASASSAITRISRFSSARTTASMRS